MALNFLLQEVGDSDSMGNAHAPAEKVLRIKSVPLFGLGQVLEVGVMEHILCVVLTADDLLYRSKQKTVEYFNTD